MVWICIFILQVLLLTDLCPPPTVERIWSHYYDSAVILWLNFTLMYTIAYKMANKAVFKMGSKLEQYTLHNNR